MGEVLNSSYTNLNRKRLDGMAFCVSALPHSLGVGVGYASFFRLSGAIKNSRPLCAFTHSFRTKQIGFLILY